MITNNRTLFTNINITASYLIIVDCSYDDMRTSMVSNLGSRGLLGSIKRTQGILFALMNLKTIDQLDSLCN